MYLTQAVDNAVYDSKVTLGKTVKYSMGDGDKAKVYIDEKSVIEAFLKTYYMSTNANSDREKALARARIVALVALDYDGFFVYSAKDMQDGIKHIISEKLPYKRSEEALTYYYTFGDEVTVFNRDTNELSYESLDELYDNKLDLSTIRSRAINASIISELNNSLSIHKRYAKNIGDSYDFYLPIGEDSSSMRHIHSVGLIAIVEGKEIATDRHFNFISYDESDLNFKEEIFAFEENAVKYYSDRLIDVTGDYLIYNSEFEAAKNGYLPYKSLVVR